MKGAGHETIRRGGAEWQCVDVITTRTRGHVTLSSWKRSTELCSKTANVTGKELTNDFTVRMWDWVYVSDFVFQNWNATLHMPIMRGESPGNPPTMLLCTIASRINLCMHMWCQELGGA